jgi:electron transfer flavoprotein alpha subunit
MLRIAVCVKQVPEVSELVLDPVTRRIRRDGVPALINPFDRRALLEAIRLRDDVGATVTAISMGPPQAEAALREALGLGVDRAVHLCDAAFAGSDTLATARALARAIEQVGADLVLAGRYSIDAETGQVGPEIAELLGTAYLGGVRRLALETSADGTVEALRAECEGDDGACELTAPLPAVVTCTDRWKTRAPIVMPDDARAGDAAVERWAAERIGGASELGQAGSPTWVAAVEPVAMSRARQRLDAREDVAGGVRAALAAIEAAVARGGEERARRPPRHPRHTDPRGAVWVVAERAPGGALRPVALELLASADDLAAALGVGVCALLLEPLPRELLARVRADAPAPAMADAALALGRAGADVLLTEEGEAFHVDAGVAAIASAISDLDPRIVLAPATALGRDVVPGIAARLGLGLTGDAIGVALDAEGRLQQLKPAFGGQVVAPILSRTRPELVTLRPGMGRPAVADPARPAAEVLRRARVAAGARRARWLEYRSEVAGDAAALESANVVVCIGYGLGARERVVEAEAVARLLGGAVGATRRVCDSGWVPRQLQIGLSGRSVAPAAVLALGVRGSFNHLVGIQRAGAIVAVNRDPEAEIFAGADLGIVADAPSFLAALRVRLEEVG